MRLLSRQRERILLSQCEARRLPSGGMGGGGGERTTTADHFEQNEQPTAGRTRSRRENGGEKEKTRRLRGPYEWPIVQGHVRPARHGGLFRLTFGSEHSKTQPPSREIRRRDQESTFRRTGVTSRGSSLVLLKTNTEISSETLRSVRHRRQRGV